jgi:hypothetical protein
MKKFLGLIAASCVLLECYGVAAEMPEVKYGAIATGDNGAYGYAYNYRSQVGAQQEALSQCGSNCSVKVWFANACGAVAKGSGYLGWAWNVEKEAAKDNALANCGNGSCEIAALTCTDR